jgi:hypothetical protein
MPSKLIGEGIGLHESNPTRGRADFRTSVKSDDEASEPKPMTELLAESREILKEFQNKKLEETMNKK